MPYSREQISETCGRNWSPTSTTVPYPGKTLHGVSPRSFATLLTRQHGPLVHPPVTPD